VDGVIPPSKGKKKPFQKLQIRFQYTAFKGITAFSRRGFEGGEGSLPLEKYSGKK